MSFWNLNDGSTVETGTSFEIGGGNLPPIPSDTGCIGAIEEAKWDSYEEDRYISLKWRVMRPSEFEKRVIFQKVKVYGTSRDKDPKATADKAKRMLAAIDTNAGGKLMKVEGEPDDMQLMSALVGKMMAIKVQVWKMTKENGEEMEGNWISAVAPAKGGNQAPAGTVKPVTPKAAPAVQPLEDLDDDDIPF